MKRSDVAAGALGALAMTAFFLATRELFGIATPSELFADVSAPYIPVHLFGLLITLVQGYTPLKIIGFVSVVIGQFAVGIVSGVFLARTPATRRILVAAASAVAFWIVAGIFFWPVLVTSYIGLPPMSARILTLFDLLAGFALFWLTASAALRVADARTDGSRRAFLAGGAGLAAVTAVGSGAVLATRTAFSYDGMQYEGPDVVSITPVSRFYVVTKNTIDPAIDRDLWRLTIGGAVETPTELSFADLASGKSVSQETTLMCINNPPEGGLMSNALWRGVPLRDLLERSGPSAGAKRVAFHAADNIIETIPYAKAMDPTTLIAFEMNGRPLPPRHGFPARAIVPGYFGERNTKWVTKITVETTELKGFYERQGWGPSALIPTHARFDAPNFSEPLRLGSIEIRGIGFCGDRGVALVELSFDDGATWRPAQFATPYNRLTWRLWRYMWKPARRATYALAVRATDSHGNVQTSSVRGAETQGATGLDRATAHVV